jgi:hypothetical protein
MSLADVVSPACPVGDGDMEEHISKTLGRLGKSLRKWLTLQILQGNLGLGFFVLDLLTLSALPVQLIVVGFLYPT